MNGTCQYCELWYRCAMASSGGSCGNFREAKTYRIKYWRWINPEYGEWAKTGTMSRSNAEKIAESLRQSHEQVEVYNELDN